MCMYVDQMYIYILGSDFDGLFDGLQILYVCMYVGLKYCFSLCLSYVIVLHKMVYFLNDLVHIGLLYVCVYGHGCGCVKGDRYKSGFTIILQGHTF